MDLYVQFNNQKDINTISSCLTCVNYLLYTGKDNQFVSIYIVFT